MQLKRSQSSAAKSAAKSLLEDDRDNFNKLLLDPLIGEPPRKRLTSEPTEGTEDFLLTGGLRPGTDEHLDFALVLTFDAIANFKMSYLQLI